MRSSVSCQAPALVWWWCHIGLHSMMKCLMWAHVTADSLRMIFSDGLASPNPVFSFYKCASPCFRSIDAMDICLFVCLFVGSRSFVSSLRSSAVTNGRRTRGRQVAGRRSQLLWVRRRDAGAGVYEWVGDG